MNMNSAMPEMAERNVAVGARQIHVKEMGQGPAVLMLHGGGAGASGWSNYSRNVEALARQFRVIVPDMPGYGQSTKGIDRNDPFGDLASTMLGLLDALGIPRAHVIGNSLGGACALRMALDSPDRVARMVLMGPGGVNVSRMPPTEGLKSLLSYYAGEGPTMEKLRTFVLQYLVHDSSKVSEALLEERFRASIDPEVIARPPLIGPIQDPAKVDFLLDPRLDTLQVPTLVLWGIEDKVNPPAGAALLQERMPRCDVYLFSRTGHWVQWERAAEFNAVTAAFMHEDDAGQASVRQ